MAHFIADFPLQLDWMVREKIRLRVLALHASMHFFITFALVGSSSLTLFPFVLVLALIHFEIDLLKNIFTVLRPNWVIVPYIIDQTIHYFSLAQTEPMAALRAALVNLKAVFR